MRNSCELHRVAQLGHVVQIFHNTSIISGEELLQYQACEQLRLRKCFGRVAMCISWQTPLPYPHRYQCHRPWRLGCVAHARCSILAAREAQPYKRRTCGVFYRACRDDLFESLRGHPCGGADLLPRMSRDSRPAEALGALPRTPEVSRGGFFPSTGG